MSIRSLSHSGSLMSYFVIALQLLETIFLACKSSSLILGNSVLDKGFITLKLDI